MSQFEDSDDKHRRYLASVRYRVKKVAMFMSNRMKNEAVSLAVKASVARRSDVEIGECVKGEMNRLYGKGWQCIVGRDYGDVTPVQGHAELYLYLIVNDKPILIFKNV